jgi:HNH endonuclease
MLKRTYFHHIKRIQLGSSLRKSIWTKHVELSVGKDNAIYFGKLPCFVCENTIIDPFNFEGGHITAVSKGGNNDVENLQAICSLCNKGMGTENLYAYKFRVYKKIHHNGQFDKLQESVVDYYNYIHSNLYLNMYQNNFYSWAYVILKSMNAKIKWENYHLENAFACKCNFEFSFCTEKNNIPLTCKNTTQNIVNIIHDHIYCLIHDKKFIDATIITPNFIEWVSNRQFLLADK